MRKIPIEGPKWVPNKRSKVDTNPTQVLGPNSLSNEAELL